ncbi:hypothetical protein DRJ16_06530 [Candidatus Woesearchaeota archaeon]|nr:MAG: hypothetical protein DRJ16_06530 [Candidatus Woesearchaeota archaeon]
MQFIEQRKYYREEILGVFRVPKALFGITDDLNYATFVGQKKMFWTETLMPLLRRFEDEINQQFFSIYAPQFVCRYDYSNVVALQEDFNKKLEQAEKLKNLGYPLNEINKRLELGMDDVNWGDVWWAPFNLVPVSSGDAAAPASTEDPDKGLPAKGTFEVQFAKAFVIKQGLLESRMESKISKYFFEQRKRVLADISEKSAKAINITINWEAEADEFEKVLNPYLKEGINQGIETARDIVPSTIDESIMQTRAASYLSYRLSKSRVIIQKWGELMVREINTAITEGQTINQISELIKARYNVIGNKAKRIARTESTGAINGGQVQYYDEAGVKQKSWVTAGDENVRDSHAILHGETVDINKNFSNGLSYPGGDGPAEEVINCRCTLIGKAI